MEKCAPVRGRNVAGLLNLVNESDFLAPFVHRAQICHRIRPTHPRTFAAFNIFADSIHFMRVQMCGAIDHDFFRRGAALANENFAGRRRLPWLGHIDRAFRSKNADAVFLFELHARREPRNNFARIFRDRRCVLVHACRSEMPDRFQFKRLTEIFSKRRTREQSRHRHRIAAHVENPAAGQLVRQQTALGIERNRESKRGLNQARFTDGLRAYELCESDRLRVAAVHERFHEKNAVAAHGIEDRGRVILIERHRLFTEDILAGLGRADRPLDVVRMRHGNINALDIAIGKQRFIRFVATHRAHFRAESFRRRARAATNREQLARSRGLQPGRESMGNFAGAKYTPLVFSAHGLIQN